MSYRFDKHILLHLHECVVKTVYWYKYSSLITKLIELGYRQISRMYATTDSAES